MMTYEATATFTTPRQVIDAYRQLFWHLHRRDPVCAYRGNKWYTINGETIHHAVLVAEIQRLQSMMTPVHTPPPAPVKAMAPVAAAVVQGKAETSVIKKLIARLRNL